MSGQIHIPAALIPGNYPRYLLDERMNALQKWCGFGGKEKNTCSSHPTSRQHYTAWAIGSRSKSELLGHRIPPSPSILLL